MATRSSRFQYVKSRFLSELTVLHAEMSDFSYDRHAHEEYAFGVTLSGRQDFFSGGEFHRSPPGSMVSACWPGRSRWPCWRPVPPAATR